MPPVNVWRYRISFFSKKNKKKTTRLFFATDLHGSERTYRKFVNAGKFYDMNVLVSGNDDEWYVLKVIKREDAKSFISS